MLGKYYFLYRLFLFLLRILIVISLTTPETERVIVCLVCVFMAFLGL